MVLADTSIWVDYLRHGDEGLAALLEAGDALCHPLVVGELACGHLHPRREILKRVSLLPMAPAIRQAEALELIDIHRLAGLGLGFIDVQLLGSAILAGAGLWTRDKILRKTAEKLGIGFREA